MQPKLSDTELLPALKRGEDAAFRQLYASHFNMIRYLVIKNSGKDEDASDVFQDGVIVLYEKLNNPDFELNASLKTFLYAVCRNIWLKRLAKNKRTAFTDFEDFDMPSEEEETDNSSEKAKLRQQLQHLGEQCRKVLMLFYYFKKSMEEISEELGYTNADNAKNQKYKCLQRLKALYAGAKPVRR